MMQNEQPPYERLTFDSFLEYAFLRWVLSPAVQPEIISYMMPQTEVQCGERLYRVDYTIIGQQLRFAVELDGFEFHGHRAAFNYDRLRQNDLQAAGWRVIRFSYDAIRLETARCITQLQTMLASDSLLGVMLNSDPKIERPEMNPDPAYALTSNQRLSVNMTNEATSSWFGQVRSRLNLKTLRNCQTQALSALSNYFAAGGKNAACVMSVGAGKTALGAVTCLAFTERRALVITPGSVIRGTFDKAFNHEQLGNALYGLPNGPLIPGCRPPRVLTMDRGEGAIRAVTRNDMLAAEVIITNFHSLGTGDDRDDLLAKLNPDDIDLIVVDEAHIAAAESYQRTFRHFNQAKTLLMSACFSRLDGKPIDADVVYRYRLIDSIADGHARNLRVRRFAPEAEETTYEMVWPDGSREEIVGREALLALVQDERKLARITAKSDASIRQVMREVRTALDWQTELLNPVKPRVLFSAMGEKHAEQIARIATDHGIPTSHLHHSMTETKIRLIRDRFEQAAGDLQGIVQLKMLGQGYDFPPVTVVVPMRPYGSFSEFYQFIGRGIRVLHHPALTGRVKPEEQVLDIIYHAELGLDEHIETIYRENDMDPAAAHQFEVADNAVTETDELPGTRGNDLAHHPDAFVLFERGDIERRIIHDEERVELRRQEREREAMAQRYSAYVQTTDNPITFEQFAQVMQQLSE
jgi:superfamily II DNA or RNA helicase